MSLVSLENLTQLQVRLKPKKKVVKRVGELGVPLTVYPWYLLCSTLGFLGIITHN